MFLNFLLLTFTLAAINPGRSAIIKDPPEPLPVVPANLICSNTDTETQCVLKNAILDSDFLLSLEIPSPPYKITGKKVSITCGPKANWIFIQALPKDDPSKNIIMELEDVSFKCKEMIFDFGISSESRIT